MYTTSKELGAIKGISEQKVIKLKEIGGCCRVCLWVLGARQGCRACGCCLTPHAHNPPYTPALALARRACLQP